MNASKVRDDVKGLVEIHGDRVRKWVEERNDEPALHTLYETAFADPAKNMAGMVAFILPNHIARKVQHEKTDPVTLMKDYPHLITTMHTTGGRRIIGSALPGKF
ncbi:MAG: hypothetical protein P4L84_11090 [Isosphaeraceae bacterium]|nr:hypothetical protein [Isosphaeraceae bacterium]